MRASFIHIADTHLGYEQYGVRERFNDFSRVFWDIMEEAVHRQVDFVVIAGDLFNKRAIDAQTLIHAIEDLKKLKERGLVSPYLRSFVVARINTLRWIKGEPSSLEEVLKTMRERVGKFNVEKIRPQDLASMAGAPPEEE